MQVLLVDDSKTMRMLVQRAIRQAGFAGLTFLEAENGARALEALAEHQPKLILSDWNMPEMSGIDFLKAVRANGIDTPFGFITSEGSKEILDTAINSGANFLITKPFTPEDVQASLTPYVGLTMDITPFTLSKLLTDLTGRRVQVTDAANKPASTQPTSAALYTVQPTGSSIVMKIDTLLLGSLGGALAGLPEALVKQQVAGALDETLRDAMHEVLNIASSALTTKGRAVLKQMITTKPQADAITRDAFDRSHLRIRYNATITGYPGGDIVLYAFA